jgi:hypothetical protein
MKVGDLFSLRLFIQKSLSSQLAREHFLALPSMMIFDRRPGAAPPTQFLRGMEIIGLQPLRGFLLHPEEGGGVSFREKLSV